LESNREQEVPVVKPRRANLKVFHSRLGFFETVVAAPSQAAALRAWGVHQNLFSEGEARVSLDAAANKAALARPGEPLRRPVGTDVAFSLQPEALPPIPRKRGKNDKGIRLRPSSRPKPDRRDLDRAKAKLDDLEAERQNEETRFEQRQAALDEEKARAEARYAQRCKAANEALATATRDYRAANERVRGAG
jgi:hypothetical protein